MADTRTPYAIPDVELERADGSHVSPKDFLGHELIVLFCASEIETAKSDVTAYAEHLEDFCKSDAWIIAICSDRLPPCGHEPNSLLMIRDRNQIAWSEFEKLLDGGQDASSDEGAVFLFDRGGNLRRAWRGAGHALEVVHAVSQRR